eukprot:jgi/Mesvir1/2080/Mv16613-RA.1
MSSFDKVRGGKLQLKGKLVAKDGQIVKKEKKRKPKADEEHQQEADAAASAAPSVDGGTGHCPEGKGASKSYEELFPAEAKRFSYEKPAKKAKEVSREEWLDKRVAKKADRYCK